MKVIPLREGYLFCFSSELTIRQGNDDGGIPSFSDIRHR